MPRSGSSANANRTRTSSANGATWFVVTRLRHSSRRSFPATSTASWSTRDHLPQGGLDGAAGDGDGAARDGLGPVELVAGDEHGGTRRRGSAEQVVDHIAAGLVEARVGLVEQPEPGPA